MGAAHPAGLIPEHSHCGALSGAGSSSPASRLGFIPARFAARELLKAGAAPLWSLSLLIAGFGGRGGWILLWEQRGWRFGRGHAGDSPLPAIPAHRELCLELLVLV